MGLLNNGTHNINHCIVGVVNHCIVGVVNHCIIGVTYLGHGIAPRLLQFRFFEDNNVSFWVRYRALASTIVL